MLKESHSAAMKHQEDKRTNRFGSLCSASGLVLSVMCCVALIHVELKIQQQHRLISHSVTSCDQLETKILRKVQQKYRKWQDDWDQWRQTKGQLIEDFRYFRRFATLSLFVGLFCQSWFTCHTGHFNILPL